MEVSIERYVSGDYRGLVQDWHEADARWKADRAAALLARVGAAPRTICDVGCGTGGVLDHLSALLPSASVAVGYDISETAISLAPSERQTRVSLRQGFPDMTERYDLLLSFDVVEHVEDYIGFLRSLRPLADRHLFHIPLDLSCQSVLRAAPILEARRRVGHLHYFMKETALATVRESGYDVVAIEYTKGSLELPPATWQARLARLPRRAWFSISADVAARALGGFSLLVLAEQASGDGQRQPL